MVLKWLAAGVASLFLALPAHAQMVRAQDPQSVVNAMQAAGYSAKLGKDKVGDPMITSASSGTNFTVFFYNCIDNKECATVQFWSGYNTKEPISLQQINAWNAGQRFARAFNDKEDDPVLEMDVDLDDGGMSRALFEDNLQYWVSLMAHFQRHIGWGD